TSVSHTLHFRLKCRVTIDFFFIFVNKSLCFCFFFFFQAEDGIRDWSVTGVQTCALPISAGRWRSSARSTARACAWCACAPRTAEIGRASCRERVEISGGGGSLKKKKKRRGGGRRSGGGGRGGGRRASREKAE